jgi:hypothetical protein
MRLLTTTSAKIDKSQNDEWLNAVMYLDPLFNKEVCKGKSKGCAQSCLINSGRMRMPSAVQARRNRTAMYFEQRELFLMALQGEIAQMLIKANKLGKKLAMRLNGTSDIDWTEVYAKFPEVQFYEYTKRPDLAKKLRKLDNVHVTFSKHENHSMSAVKRLIKDGINVAVVFKDRVPEQLVDLKVIDGDKNDRRFEDEQGAIIGLKLKGTNDIKRVAVETGFAL